MARTVRHPAAPVGDTRRTSRPRWADTRAAQTRAVAVQVRDETTED